ncbi:MAG: DUF4199 domain-containing protein [Bacteroidetes bacterium]|nr:DUF4199 domain-containing protein [Bacteroidota bacterium]MDA0888220.1 DUF4199 domain-containing protein [Bacteroidota bacterium]MDA1084342.1 DUF4199 domain-containing protein [Bacteroidota bacterium]
METSPKLGTYNYRFGLIAAGIGIVFSLMLYFMDMIYNQSPIIQAINILIPSTLAVLAIQNFKKDNDGFLSIKQSIKIGVGVFLVAGIIGLVYFTLFINTIEPDFISNTAQMQADALREARPELEESMIQMQQENTEKFFYVGFPVILIFNLFIGLIIGLVTGLFTKKS